MPNHLHVSCVRCVYPLVRQILLSGLKFAVCLAIILPVPAATNISEILNNVENRYNRVKTLQVNFRETYTAPGRGRRTESGVLYLRKPGRMRWDYSQPEGKQFLADGRYFYLYNPGANRVQKVDPKRSADMHAPLAFLLGRVNFQKDFRRFESRPEGADTWIKAIPNSEDLPYKEVDFLVGPDTVIKKVRVMNQDQSVIDFDFDQEKVNPPLKDSLFVFKSPEGAQVVEAVE